MLDSVDDYEVPSENEASLDGEQQAIRNKWIRTAREVYQASTDYLENSVRKQWEKNLYNFQGRHKSDEDRAKKLFRPKVRSSLRAHEAALAAALFTNNDLTFVQGVDPNDKLQEKSAELNQALLQYRLDKTIPWFQTVIGAYQDTHIHGICISKTYWAHDTKDITDIVPLTDDNGEYVMDEEGNMLGMEAVVDTETIRDEPVIDLLAPENFRYDPNADWRNPIKDSPYLIEMIPMYVGDVIERMGKKDSKTGQPDWHQYELSQVISHGSTPANETVRQARSGRRNDPHEIDIDNEYQTVWIHFNIVREKGVDMAFYTIGTELLLSDPVPLTDYYKLGRETYTIGNSTIEAHRNYPASLAELGENLQNEINIIANQRIENVRLVMNKRYFIRKQGDVDLAALMRNRAGGGIMVSDVVNDVRVIETPDVTSSSYAEQDRLNMDIDEVLGTFSQSTINSNRNLNETVGGMNLMASTTNSVQEYVMRTFIETWVEPVLRALVKLEQYYETDDKVLALAQDKAGIKAEMQQYAGNPEVLDSLIQQDLTVTVNVGMGNTSPEQKVNRLMLAIGTAAQLPEAPQLTNWSEVIKELYAYAGFGTGQRFLLTEQELQQRQAQQPQLPPEVQVEQMRLQARQNEIQMQIQAQMQEKQMELQSRERIEIAKLAAGENKSIAQMQTQLGIAQQNDKTKRDIEALKATNFSRELNAKFQLGSGI